MTGNNTSLRADQVVKCALGYDIDPQGRLRVLVIPKTSLIKSGEVCK